MRKSSTLGGFAVYAILVAGSVVFAFPFIWMFSTSLKEDRELFRSRLSIVPEQPDPRLQSPYYDPREFAEADVDSSQAAVLLPMLRRQVAAAAESLPADVGGLHKLIALGMLTDLSRKTPAAIWEGDAERLLAYAMAQATPARLLEIAQQAYRELGLGALQAWTSDLREVTLLQGDESTTRWRVLSPQAGRLYAAKDGQLDFAAVGYDLSSADRLVLQADFNEIPAADLQRLALRLRPDDTWHDLWLTVEAAGTRYRAERAVPLADNRWTVAMWQKPSADDYSTKLKTWLVLRPAETGPQFDHGPSTIRLTLELHKATAAHASFTKARQNYQKVLDQIPFWRYVRVSVLLVILNIVLTVLSSSLVAYAFARLQWPGRDAAFLIMLGTMMIPGQVTMIPHFLIWKWLGAYNTLTPLYAGAIFGNAFFIFLMRQFLKGIPTDLEDAARIDGCGVLRIWWHVMLPLVKPSLAAIAIFTFMASWNDFLGPLVYVADQRLYPLAFGLYALSVQVDNNPVLMMAASVLMTLPVIVVFFLAQRTFVEGITLTGMKG